MIIEGLIAAIETRINNHNHKYHRKGETRITLRAYCELHLFPRLGRLLWLRERRIVPLDLIIALGDKLI